MKKLREVLNDAAGNYSYITVTSDKSVMIEGCSQILECDENIARVVTNQFIIEVDGSDLKLNSFNNSTVKIFGNILSISLERKRRGV